MLYGYVITVICLLKSGVCVKQVTEKDVRWSRVSIPTALVESIKDRMGDESYQSVSEFVRDACRRRLEVLQERYPVKPVKGREVE
jgi:hypothetical protein